MNVEDQVDEIIQILADEALAGECARRGIDIDRLGELDDEVREILADWMSRGRRDDVFAELARRLPAARECEVRA